MFGKFRKLRVRFNRKVNLKKEILRKRLRTYLMIADCILSGKTNISDIKKEIEHRIILFDIKRLDSAFFNEPRKNMACLETPKCLKHIDNRLSGNYKKNF